MEVEKESSVLQWLRLCVERGSFDDNKLKNPMYRDYWSDLSYYHGHTSKVIRRFWDKMPTIDIDWNPFLYLKYAYADYEKRVLNNDIKLNDEENVKKDLKSSAFEKRIIGLLGIDNMDVFQFTLPGDVVSRMEDTINEKPIRRPIISSIRKSKAVDKTVLPLEKPMEGERPRTVIYIGDKEILVSKLDLHKNKRKAEHIDQGPKEKKMKMST